MLAALLLSVAALVACWVVVRSTILYSKACKLFPSPPRWPVIGHVIDYWGDEAHIFKLMLKYRRLCGPRWAVKLMDEVSLNLCDPEGAEAVMTSRKHITKGPLYHMLHSWLGQGLLTNSGYSWHQRRKLLTPAFHFKILDEFGPLLATHSRNLVKDLREVCGLNKGAAVDVVTPVSKVTLRSICETAMGVDLRTCGNEDEYFTAVRKYEDLHCNFLLCSIEPVLA